MLIHRRGLITFIHMKKSPPAPKYFSNKCIKFLDGNYWKRRQVSIKYLANKFSGTMILMSTIHMLSLISDWLAYTGITLCILPPLMPNVSDTCMFRDRYNVAMPRSFTYVGLRKADLLKHKFF